MSSTTPRVDSTLNFDSSAHEIALEDLDFLDAIEAPVSASEVLTGDTVLGRPTGGKAHGKVSDLLGTLNPGEFHPLGTCPFRPATPSPKGKGATAMVNDARTRLTVMCWAAEEHEHPAETVRTSTDGRTYAVFSWGPNATASRDTIPSDDQSYLADHVLRLLEAKHGLLAVRVAAARHPRNFADFRAPRHRLRRVSRVTGAVGADHALS